MTKNTIWALASAVLCITSTTQVSDQTASTCISGEPEISESAMSDLLKEIEAAGVYARRDMKS